MSKSTTGNPFVTTDEIEWESVDKGVTRQVLGHDDQLMLVRIKFEKGGIGPLHHHPHRQVSYVEAGRFEVQIDGKKQILKQGDTFLVAPDLVHGVLALEKGSLLDIFTPARKDFI